MSYRQQHETEHGSASDRAFIADNPLPLDELISVNHKHGTTPNTTIGVRNTSLASHIRENRQLSTREYGCHLSSTR